ncbi:hypothetical protein [Candidatus Tisiphia endosymbiont of Mystacides longicornis]|uniref:hypothetical protein n=1 Tax=Candidatus Tisiphia endosymbiont of Mystacides longicornis TaxID=3139330 RepID=UPI003CCA7657
MKIKALLSAPFNFTLPAPVKSTLAKALPISPIFPVTSPAPSKINAPFVSISVVIALLIVAPPFSLSVEPIPSRVVIPNPV